VTDNGDGTITVRTAVTGIPEQVTLPDGTVAYKDVGRVVFATVLDYNGIRPTPTVTCSSLNRSSQCPDRTPSWTAVSRCSAPR
jgi:hypothetical protein